MSTKKKDQANPNDRNNKKYPTTKIIPSFNPFGNIKQPEWIKEKFPNLVTEQNHNHLLRSIRHLSHRGHQVEIITTYEIIIDGKIIRTHAMVDQEGKVWCHAIPYRYFSSASEMVRNLIDSYSDVIHEGSSIVKDGDEDDHSHHEEH